MLSKTAEIDLKALRSAGYAPTDEEIVKLNDLALRIERGKDMTPANMPRFALAGNVVLHEPTVGAELWWNDYGKDLFVTDKRRMLAYVFMCAHARDVKFLNSVQDPSEARKTILKWAKSVDATESEIWRAVLWIKCGSEEIAAEIDESVKTSLADEERRNALWLSIIAASSATGISPSDLETKTRSELDGMLMYANLLAHIPMKANVASDYIAYRQLIRGIEDRGAKENG